MKSMGNLLEVVGNETRRRILALLSEEPRYISEISRKLNVTQPAILKHLSVLQTAGLIEGFWRKNPLGAPRKYYKICDSVGIEIAINPKEFRITRQSQRMNCSKYLETEQAMKRLTEEINRTKDVATKAAKAEELVKMANSLLSCTGYQKGSWNCENCHRAASLRKEASQVILYVSRGEIDSGLRKLTETIDKLTTGWLPKSRR
jgi:ArsR family transcriptional regulator